MTFNFSLLATFPTPIRLTLFLLVLLVLWLPLAAPIYWLGEDPNTVSILTLILLYGEFLLLVQFWGKSVYQHPQLLQHYGLKLTKRSGWALLQGLSLGCLSLLTLLILQGKVGWLVWKPASTQFPQIVFEGLLVGLGVGFAEELFFRGWLLDELQRDYHPTLALWVSSLVYAIAHFIKPLTEIYRTALQFPGLVLLGLIFVWAKYVIVEQTTQPTVKLIQHRSKQLQLPSGNISLSVGLHAGLVWGYYIVNVGERVQYSSQVPHWITGVDQNPLAGVIGLVFVGVLFFGIRKISKFHNF